MSRPVPPSRARFLIALATALVAATLVAAAAGAAPASEPSASDGASAEEGSAPSSAQASPDRTPLTREWLRFDKHQGCRPGTGCLPFDTPQVVDERGDTMFGDLSMEADIVLPTVFDDGEIQPHEILIKEGNRLLMGNGSKLVLENDAEIVGQNATIANADTLDGLNSSQFMRSDVSDAFTNGTLTLADGTELVLNGTVDSDIIPTKNATYALGNNTNRWTDVWLASVLHYGSDGLQFESGGDIQATLTPDGKLQLAGEVNATSFAGDGSNLTGVEASDLANDTVTSPTIVDGSVAAPDVNASQVQLRVSDSCGSGSSIRSIGQDGTVTCEADDDTTYSAGDGLALSGTTFAVQACSADEILKHNGTAWNCAADDDTTYSGGTGITVSGTTIENDLGSAIESSEIADGTIKRADLAQDGCSADQVIRWDDGSSSWVCSDTTSGDITGVDAGSGLDGGGTSGDVSVSVNTSETQARVSDSCGSEASIDAINQDGTVSCEADDDTTYSAGDGLDLSGTTFRLDQSCADAEVLKYDTGTGSWTCAADEDTTYSGGTGITVSGTTIENDLGSAIESGEITDGTVVAADVDSTAVQERVSGTCGSDAAIDEINQDGTVSCENENTVDAWLLGGNAGTTAGTDFLGTTDAETLVLKVNDTRIYALEPASGDTSNVVGGNKSNTVTAGVRGATISGGGTGDLLIAGSRFGPMPNNVTDIYSTVSGGADNTAGDDDSDPESAPFATVGGGIDNTASDTQSTVGGGIDNIASGIRSTVAGGQDNIAGGTGAAIPGGENNLADGNYSFAAGAGANASHDGSFVWSDSTSTTTDSFGSTNPNQFLIDATGGVGIGTENPTDALEVAGTIDANDAELGLDSIESAEIQDGAVRSSEVADGSLAAADVDSTSIQERVSGTCGSDAAIDGVNQDGTVSCETDDVDGGDAETLDGLDSTQFLRSDTSDTFEGSMLTLDENLTVGDKNDGIETDLDRIVFGNPGWRETFAWNESDTGLSRFTLSNTLEAEGFLLTNQDSIGLNYGDFGGTADICFAEGGNNCGEFIRWDDSLKQFNLSQMMVAKGPIEAAGHLGGEDLFLNLDGPDGDSHVCFYEDGASCGESLEWDDSIDGFDLSDTLRLTQGRLKSDLHLESESPGDHKVFWDTIDSGSGDLDWVANGTSLSDDHAMELDQDGDLRIGGTLTTNAFDVAESYRRAEAVSAGELVRVDPADPTAVRKASSEHPGVLGIVSTEPGVLLGGTPGSVESLEETWGPEAREEFDAQRPRLRQEVLAEHPSLSEKLASDDPAEVASAEEVLRDQTIEAFADEYLAPVALSGRVPTQVATTNGPIEAGDPLTVSPTPGVAEKADPGDPVVGKALEGLEVGTAKIQVFVTPAWRGGGQADAGSNGQLADQVEELERENAQLRDRIEQLEERLDRTEELQDRLDRLERLEERLDRLENATATDGTVGD